MHTTRPPSPHDPDDDSEPDTDFDHLDSDRFEPPLALDIETHEADFVFRQAHARGWKPWQMALIGLLPSVPMVVAAWMSGALFPAAGWARVSDDWRLFALGEPSLPSSATFPLARDYTTLLLVGLLATTVGLGHKLLNHLRRSFGAMADAGVLRVRSEEDLEDIADSLRATNRMIAKADDYRVAFWFIAFVAAVAVVIGRLYSGLYLRLAPPPTDFPIGGGQWVMRTREAWWAAPIEHPACFFTYLVMMVTLANFILKIDWVSVWFIRFWIQNRDRIRFTLCPSEPYTFRGYRDLRSALMSATILIALDFVVLVAVFLSTADTAHRWLVLPVIAFGTLSPAFLLVPMALFWRHAHDHRAALARACDDRLVSIYQVDPDGQHELKTALRQEAAAIRKIPTIPFRWPRVTITAAAWLVTLVAAVMQLWTTL